MAMTEPRPVISEAYKERLTAVYGEEAVWQVTDGLRYADLPHQPGEHIAYARVGSQEDPTVLYIPGYSEGIVAKAAFALELASRRFNVILPDQHRGIVRNNPDGKRSARYTQALDTMAILHAEVLVSGDEPVHAAAHSYGVLSLESLIKLARLQGLGLFKDSKLAFLAPAGSHDRENLLSLGIRFARHMLTEGKTAKDFPDETGKMQKAGIDNLKANKRRSWQEIRELASHRVDYEYVAKSGIAGLAIFGFAEDRLFHHGVLERAVQKAIEAGATYASPIHLGKTGSAPRSGRDASHNDEQFNPARVAGAVAEFLRG